MGLEFIITNKAYQELGFLKNATIDIEIGKYGVAKNDFELTIPIASREVTFDEGSLFYCNNTEWGGIVKRKKVDTGKEKITFKGSTFRGLLENEYVQPSDGESHLVLKGDANTCINTLIQGRFGGLFVVDDIGSSGITVNYQVRYLNVLQALEKTLNSGGAKLDIYFNNLDKKVHLKASLIKDLSDSTRYDNDYQIQMIVETKDQQYNHILALGQGELEERLKLNLYLHEDGSWGDSEYYSGLDKKTYKFEDVNSDTLEKLRENALKKINDQRTTDNLDISFDADDVSLFDIVGAKEKITGVEFKEQVTQKILKGSIDSLSVSYKVGEESKQSSNSTESQTETSGTGGGSGEVSEDCMLISVYDTDHDGVVDNAEKVNGHTVLKDVPADAKFTDTVYTHPISHSASMIIENSDRRFVSDSDKTKWNAKSDFSGSYNDLTNKPTLGALASKSVVSKSDLDSGVQSSLNKADTALQSFTETDPTVPRWAKQPNKPTYTASEVGADAKGSADAVQGNLNTHSGNASNPHKVTKAQVGLGNVDNTSDMDKPVSNAQQEAITSAVEELGGAFDEVIYYMYGDDITDDGIPTIRDIADDSASKSLTEAKGYTDQKTKNLDSEIADINTLLFGSATGNTLTTEFSNSVIALISDASIDSAKIKSLVADKITSGSLNTNNVTIKSNDGKLQITGDTILVKDANRTRVQIGKDANADYNIYILDASGKVMFDATGIHADAIKSPIIENAMVSSNANISASKLDIDSLFSEINGSSNTIKSTKVYFDDKKQTLDVAFGTVTTDISDVKKTLTSHGTAITTMQGQISSKIWMQDVNRVGDRVTEQETKVSELEQNLEGFQTTVRSTYVERSEIMDGSGSGGDTLTWDGNTDGKECYEEFMYKVSDVAPTLTNGVLTIYYLGEPMEGPFDESNIISDGPVQGIMIGELPTVMSVPSDIDFGDGDIVSKGTYFLAMDGIVVTSLKVNGFTGFGASKIKESLMPQDYATVTEMETAITQSADSITSTVSNTYATKSALSEVKQTADSLTVSLQTTNQNVTNASKTATNHLKFDSNGLVIGDMTASSLGRNVLIDSDSVDIRNGSTTLASYQDSKIQLGLNAETSIIEMCGKKGEISYNTLPLLGTSKYLALKSSGGVGLSSMAGVVSMAYVGSTDWSKIETNHDSISLKTLNGVTNSEVNLDADSIRLTSPVIEVMLANSYPVVKYLNSAGTLWGKMGFSASDTPAVELTSGVKKLIHEGNYTDYCAKASHSHDYVPTSRTVNGKALSSNISLSASDVGAAPSSHSHSEYATSGHTHDDRYYTESEIDTKLSGKSDTGHSHSNYVPTSRTVNGKALSGNITLSASDVSAVPTSRTVNGKALSSNITLSASDVGASASGHGHSASEINFSGANIKPYSIDLGGSSSHGGYIDFHYNNEGSDYTTRIIEMGRGKLGFHKDGDSTQYRILTSLDVIVTKNTVLQFTNGVATYSDSRITANSSCFAQRFTASAGNVLGFTTECSAGKVTIATETWVNALIGVNLLIFNHL